MRVSVRGILYIRKKEAKQKRGHHSKLHKHKRPAGLIYQTVEEILKLLKERGFITNKLSTAAENALTMSILKDIYRGSEGVGDLSDCLRINPFNSRFLLLLSV